MEDFEIQQEQLFIVGWQYNTVVGFYSTLKKLLNWIVSQSSFNGQLPLNFHLAILGTEHHKENSAKLWNSEKGTFTVFDDF